MMPGLGYIGEGTTMGGLGTMMGALHQQDSKQQHAMIAALPCKCPMHGKVDCFGKTISRCWSHSICLELPQQLAGQGHLHTACTLCRSGLSSMCHVLSETADASIYLLSQAAIGRMMHTQTTHVACPPVG